MKPSALILTAGIFILALFGCVPPPPPQGGVAAPPSRAAAVCSADTFLSKVHYLAQTTPPFSLPSSGFQKAPPIDATSIDPNITQDLTAAFNTAPVFFRNQLCKLTGIYIDRTGCTSYDPRSCNGPDPSDRLWGFRAFDGNGNSAGEFIGTWLGLWQKGIQGHAPVLSKFEKGRLQALLNWTSSNAPAHDFVQPDTVEMTVLAVLSHELGHVFWYDAFVMKPDGSPNPGGPADFGKFCGGTFYQPVGVGQQGSWLLPPDLPDHRWVSFGDPRNHHRPDDVDMTKLGFDLDHQRFPDAGDLLHGIYSGQLPDGINAQNGRWASALAAFSTDEDFVETFQLFLLRHASPPLLHSRVRIVGTGGRSFVDDIPATFDQKPELVRKSHVSTICCSDRELARVAGLAIESAPVVTKSAV